MTTGSSNADDVDQRNPKTHENGGGKSQDLGQTKVSGTDNVVKSKTCFVCDGEDDWVLVCYGEECPVAIHQSCACDKPDFDEFGNFYCPYCWYKRVVSKCVELGKKVMVSGEKSIKGCRETLGRVDLGLMMDIETEDVENVVEVNGNILEGDGSNKRNSQKMKEVGAQTHSRANSKAGDIGLSKGRKQRRRFNEKNHETSDAFVSKTGEGDHEGSNSDVGRERKRQKRCNDISHDTAQADIFVVCVKTREKRRYSEKNQQNRTVSGTHEQDVFINDKGTQARNCDLGHGRSGKGYCNENNQQKKVSSTERCEQKASRTDKRVFHGSGLVEGRHIEKNQLTETIETENLVKEVFKDMKRKRELGVERDGDDIYLVENQCRQCQPDMRNGDVAFFRNDERVERKSVSSISSPESTNNVNESNVAAQELALIIHPKAGVQEQPIEARPLCSIYSKKPSSQPEKYGHKSYLEKNGTVSNDPGERRFVLCSDKKRKRLLWTQAEEEMLRVGVQKFPWRRNIPWRKILEFGRDVFHDGRAPSDLKDKWKTMNKMPCDTGNWVRLSTERQPNYYVSEVSSE